ncbi:MAG: hypothetical protein LBS96_07345, partial [Oscillospiraceae bacterium]|nr:hypothetical protein [Oscillospiraceae bacterium]
MKKLSHKAQWIWDASNTRPNDFVVFRCAFPVESLPGKAVAHIAAETKYWLWINGALAVFEGGLFRESL